MSAFIVAINPPLLVHLVEKAVDCGDAPCVQLVAAAVMGQADELPEPTLFAIATRIIARLHAGGLPPFVEIAWRDTLATVRREGLHLDVDAA